MIDKIKILLYGGNKIMTYEMDIAGLKRDLTICPVTDDLSIGAFVMFGDVELTVACAAASAAEKCG